jgi:hypothetical protein
MRRNRQRLLELGAPILGLLIVSPALRAQETRDSAAIPRTNDWSHHHVIFSRPGTVEQSARVKQDPRYWQQQSRRLPAILSDTSRRRGGRNLKIKRDWSQYLGGGASIGAVNYPAKYSFQATNANCAGTAQPDFVVYGTGLAGSTTQASIVAFDNLYSGCSGTVPLVYWAYNTGGTVTTSPLFSRDGTQVAFVQTDGSGDGNLVLLKWAASTTDTVGHPTTLTRVANNAYPGCSAPCMTTGLLPDGSGTLDADTNSSPFYDYGNDIAYIGDDAGWLHKISPVFFGIPGEVRSAGWPVQVNPLAATALTSPVHDSTSDEVFVADAGGFLYRVGASTAFVATSGQLDFSNALDLGPGIVQGPIVDSTAELVYVFAASDGSASCVGGSDCSAVYQLAADFPESNTGSKSKVGASTISGATPSPLYIGAFDSTYENSVNATGNLYVCGNTGGDPVLYQVAILSGAMNSLGTAGPVLSTRIAATPCSPVTDIMNPNAAGGATEWMFASAQTRGSSTGCSSHGCVFNFKDTPWKPSTAYTVGQEILDSHFQIQVVSAGGNSGAAPPGWATMIGDPTPDGTVHWLDQGPQSAFTLAAWTSGHPYALGDEILDGNNNVQFVTTAGTSGGSAPTFNMLAGGITSDGATLQWTNLGALGTAALPAAGGTSGIIIDNTVVSGTLGTSQIYFSTLSNQTCGTSGSGGCAVQASQSALK